MQFREVYSDRTVTSGPDEDCWGCGGSQHLFSCKHMTPILWLHLPYGQNESVSGLPVIRPLHHKRDTCLLLPEIVFQMMDNPAGIAHACTASTDDSKKINEHKGPCMILADMAIEATKIYTKHPELFDDGMRRFILEHPLRDDLITVKLSGRLQKSALESSRPRPLPL
jgi:hypothetical protein